MESDHPPLTRQTTAGTRRIVQIRLAVIGIAAAALIATPAAAARDRCAVSGTRTLKANASVSVLKRHNHHGTTWFGCLRSSGALTRLGHDPPGDGSLSGGSVNNVRVAGTSVALIHNFFEDIGTEGEESDTIVVADLSPGGRHYHRRYRIGEFDRHSDVAKLVLRDDGAAAWTVVAADDKHVAVEVLGPDATAKRRVASGTGIARRSVAIGPEGVSWKQDGNTHTEPVD